MNQRQFFAKVINAIVEGRRQRVERYVERHYPQQLHKLPEDLR